MKIIEEIIINTDENFQFSSGRLYSIVIYEYLGNGKVEELHEGYIDSCLNYLCNLQDIGFIWTDSDKEGMIKRINFYLREKVLEQI